MILDDEARTLAWDRARGRQGPDVVRAGYHPEANRLRPDPTSVLDEGKSAWDGWGARVVNPPMVEVVLPHAVLPDIHIGSRLTLNGKDWIVFGIGGSSHGGHFTTYTLLDPSAKMIEERM